MLTIDYEQNRRDLQHTINSTVLMFVEQELAEVQTEIQKVSARLGVLAICEQELLDSVARRSSTPKRLTYSSSST